jgi:hypothetical protein
MSDEWFCEECGEEQTGQPPRIETYPAAEGTVELWFCEECARYER